MILVTIHNKTIYTLAKKACHRLTDDTDTHCDYNISDHTPDTQDTNDTHMNFAPKYPAIHSQ